ncbi:MAG TPA: BTAD domain-containing putative transcriptional regulator [Gemmatimonadaceae bacterium]|nr:BTAD domain-containing putative transcriptional regulator [Gemmatimonadaceae bacterium]
MTFRLVALGELALSASDQGRKLAVPKKGLALMALLASAGARGVPREKIASLLWPDSEDSGRGALKQTIYELRQTLGNHNVVIGAAELTLDPAEITSDVGDLESAYAREQWTRVVQLYAGPFLDRFHVRGSADFDHWVDSQRARYAGTFRDALEKSARAATEGGDHQMAAALWRRLAAEDPLNSRVALGLINTLADASDPAGALTHYGIHEQLLREELGTQPDALLTSTAARIRTGGTRPRQDTEPRRATSVRDGLPAARATSDSSAAPTLPRRSIESLRWHTDRRLWVAILLLLATGGTLASAWVERSPVGILASIALPPNSASRVTVDPHLHKIFVDGGASYDHSLTVVDGDTEEAQSLPHGSGVAVDPATHWLWSGDYGGRFVAVRNGRTNAEIGRIQVPGCPHHFAIDGPRTWVAQQCDDHITVIDNRTRAIIRHIPVPTLSRDEVSGAKGMGEIFVNRTTGIVYFWKDMIPHRLDPGSWQMRETPGIDGAIIAINEPANRLYARIDNGLQVIDGATEKVVAHVQLPGTPVRVAVGFGGRRVYVVTPKNVSALDGSTHRVLWTMPFEDGFTAVGIAADDGRRRLYVIGSHADGRRSLKILGLSE